MQALYLLAATLLSAGDFGAADLGKMKDSAKAGSNVQGVAHVDPIGTTAAKGKEKAVADAWNKAFMKGAVTTLAAKKACIVKWVNANGGVPMKDGTRKALNEAAFDAVLAKTAGGTEYIFGVMYHMKRLTGRDQGVPAVAIVAELKKIVEEQQSIKIGTPGKNAVCYKGGPGEEAPKAGEDGGNRAAHEFLHILLRQFDNPDIGGGPSKSNSCPEIANRHHQLVSALGIQDTHQSSLPAFDCAAEAPAGDPKPNPLPDSCKQE